MHALESELDMIRADHVRTEVCGTSLKGADVMSKQLRLRQTERELAQRQVPPGSHSEWPHSKPKRFQRRR